MSLDHRSSVHRSRREFASSVRAENIKVSRRWESHRMASPTLTSLVPPPPTQEALDSEFKPIQLLEGRVDPLMVGVWPRKLKAREAIAYFQYSDANGGRLADRGKRRRLWVAYFRKCFEIRGGVIVWTTRPRKHSHIDVTIRIIVALTTKLSPYGAR